MLDWTDILSIFLAGQARPAVPWQLLKLTDASSDSSETFILWQSDSCSTDFSTPLLLSPFFFSSANHVPVPLPLLHGKPCLPACMAYLSSQVWNHLYIYIYMKFFSTYVKDADFPFFYRRDETDKGPACRSKGGRHWILRWFPRYVSICFSCHSLTQSHSTQPNQWLTKKSVLCFFFSFSGASEISFDLLLFFQPSFSSGAAYMIGRGVASVFWGVAADRVGRKPVLAFSVFSV